jgi:hypothetical protein
VEGSGFLNEKPNFEHQDFLMRLQGVANLVGLPKDLTTETTHLPWRAVPGKITEKTSKNLRGFRKLCGKGFLSPFF